MEISAAAWLAALRRDKAGEIQAKDGAKRCGEASCTAGRDGAGGSVAFPRGFSLQTPPWRSLPLAVRARLQEPQRVFAPRYPEGVPRVRRTDGGHMGAGWKAGRARGWLGCRPHRVTTMLHQHGKPWRSMCKGLILGTLLTSFMLLLYSYAVPPLQVSMTEVSVPSCSSSQLQAKGPAIANSTRSASGANCRPKLNIMFMKTHKTASSTILNILFRFGEKHRLKFAFPNGRNDFYYPSFFERSQVQHYRPGMCFNIICNHMRFHYEEVRKLLPADTTFVTVLRDPAYLFESSFHYFGRIIPLTWKLPGEDKLAEFLRDPWHYYDPNGFNAHYLQNLLFFDLGYDNNMKADSPLVEQHILEIEQRFHLVMLMEYFDESLVLLKELLCWQLEDILYFKLNARKGSTVSRLTPELYDKATAWNLIDAKLYRYFNATFWRKVEAYGRERMAKDVAELQRENEKMKSICIDGGHAVDASAIQESSMQPWQPLGEKSILGYNLKKKINKKHQKLCRKMLTPEIQYLTDLGVNLWITKLWSRVRDFLKW